MNEVWLDTISKENRHIIDLREMDIPGALTLGRFHYTQPAQPLPSQNHPHWIVLVFVLRGAQHYRLNASDYTIQAGQGLCIPPHTKYSTGPWPELKGEVAWFIMEAQGELLRIKQDTYARIKKTVLNCSAQPTFSLTPQIREAIETAFWIHQNAEATWKTSLLRNSLESILLLTMHSLLNNLSLSTQFPQSVISIVNAIRSNPLAFISVEEMILKSAMSPVKFYEHFRRITGDNPLDYILRLRLENAARILRESATLPVTNLAHEMGFSSSQYFSTAFKKHFGVTPSAWRSSFTTPSNRIE